MEERAMTLTSDMLTVSLNQDLRRIKVFFSLYLPNQLSNTM